MRAEVYWIQAPCARLAVLPRPRSGEYLVEEIASMRVQGIEVLVSLLTEPEVGELDLEREAEACEQHDVQFVRFPIDDRGVPADDASATALVERLHELLMAGRAVGVHCRAGMGRSAMMAAAVLVQMGLPADDAFRAIKIARGCDVPDTEAQRAWVERLGSGS
jgi:protein-tyrosine phosphatase